MPGDVVHWKQVGVCRSDGYGDPGRTCTSGTCAKSVSKSLIIDLSAKR